MFRLFSFCRSGDFWIGLRRYSSKFLFLIFSNETLLTFRYYFFLGSVDSWIGLEGLDRTSKVYYLRSSLIFLLFFDETLLIVMFRSTFFLQVGWLLDRIPKVFFFGVFFLFFFFNETFINVSISFFFQVHGSRVIFGQKNFEGTITSKFLYLFNSFNEMLILTFHFLFFYRLAASGGLLGVELRRYASKSFIFIFIF